MDLFAKTIEYVNDRCYVDGVLQNTNSTCTTAGTVALAILLPLILIGLALFVWWIVTLVHVLTHPDVPNRVLWIVLHFAVGSISAPVYHFAAKRPYEKSKHSAVKPAAE